jgi:tRNA-modifying protein YgfZ
VMAEGSPAGTWAYEARRIAAGVPRIGLDTDQRAIPNEIGVLGSAVHMNKGCYPGQETVGRVQALGRPPRRLVRLHLDGSAEALPEVGAPILLDGRQVGRMGSSARHWEDGPIGLGLVKRNVPTDAEFIVDEIAAGQEVLVDPEIGDHFRPQFA